MAEAKRQKQDRDLDRWAIEVMRGVAKALGTERSARRDGPAAEDERAA